MSRADRSTSRRRLDGLLRASPGDATLAPGARVATATSEPVTRAHDVDAVHAVTPEVASEPTALTPTWPVPVIRSAGPSPIAGGSPPETVGPPVTGWVPGAMRVAARDYRDEYGSATDLSGDEDPPVRVRWAVPWRLTASAATVVALVVGATIIRATALAPGDPVDLPTPAIVSTATSAAMTALGGAGDAAPAGTSSATGAPQVVVHVVGAVAAPGVVRLPAGARVQDALTAAGGALAEADLAALNLARVVADGEQIVVPRPGESVRPTSAASMGTAAGRLDLNAAALADLDGLPGIGPVLAQRILDHRTQHRFTSVDELGEVSGIGPTLLERLRPLVRV